MKENEETIKSETPGKSMFSLWLIFGSLHCGYLGSSVVTAASMRPGCRRFESCSGHLIFPPFGLFNIDWRIRIYLSDDK